MFLRNFSKNLHFIKKLLSHKIHQKAIKKIIPCKFFIFLKKNSQVLKSISNDLLVWLDSSKTCTFHLQILPNWLLFTSRRRNSKISSSRLKLSAHWKSSGDAEKQVNRACDFGSYDWKNIEVRREPQKK